MRPFSARDSAACAATPMCGCRGSERIRAPGAPSGQYRNFVAAAQRSRSVFRMSACVLMDGPSTIVQKLLPGEGGEALRLAFKSSCREGKPGL